MDKPGSIIEIQDKAETPSTLEEAMDAARARGSARGLDADLVRARSSASAVNGPPAIETAATIVIQRANTIAQPDRIPVTIVRRDLGNGQHDEQINGEYQINAGDKFWIERPEAATLPAASAVNGPVHFALSSTPMGIELKFDRPIEWLGLDMFHARKLAEEILRLTLTAGRAPK